MKAADCLCQNRSMHTRCIFSSTSLAKSQTIERIAIQLFISFSSGKYFRRHFPCDISFEMIGLLFIHLGTGGDDKMHGLGRLERSPATLLERHVT